jgi:hypothetical protein
VVDVLEANGEVGELYGREVSKNEQLYQKNADDGEALSMAMKMMTGVQFGSPVYLQRLEAILREFKSWAAVCQLIQSPHSCKVLIRIYEFPGLVKARFVAKKNLYETLLDAHGGVSTAHPLSEMVALINQFQILSHIILEGLDSMADLAVADRSSKEVTSIWTNEVLQLADDMLEKVNMKDTRPYRKYYIGLAEAITAAVENQEWEIPPEHEKVMKALPGHLKSAASKSEVPLISPAYLSQLEVRWKKLDGALKEVSQFGGQ